MPPCHGGGREFESRPVRHTLRDPCGSKSPKKTQVLRTLFFCYNYTMKKIVIIFILVVFLSPSLAHGQELADGAANLSGSYDTRGMVWDLAKQDNLVYLAALSDGLHIVDVSDPTKIKEIAVYDPGQPVRSVEVQGSYAYIGVSFLGLYVLDISNPSNPVLISKINPYSNYWDLAIDGHYIYVATVSGLGIIDISNPLHPVEVARLDLEVSGNRQVRHVNIVDYYIYASGDELNIIDVFDPFAPVLKGTYGNGIGVLDATKGVAVTMNNYRIINDNDVENPTTIVNYSAYSGVRVIRTGNLLYTLESGIINDGNIVQFDLTKPNGQQLVGRYSIKGNPLSFQVSDGYVYIGVSFTHDSGGLYVYNLEKTFSTESVIDGPPTTSSTGNINYELAKRLAGRILLQVERQGQAWYLNPVDSKRYYLANGDAAYNLMTEFGLGITDTDLAKLPATKGQSGDWALVKRLSGRIVLQVQQHGEAWYINPADGLRYYLKDGPAAYQMMRLLSLGITDADLSSILAGEL